MAKKEIRVKVYGGEQYDSPDFPGYGSNKLIEVIAWFQAKLNSIPEEYRERVNCSFDTITYVRIEIDYWRMEMDEEHDARLPEERENRVFAKKQRLQELETLRILKEKYEKKNS